jgi:hypothetical protein
MNAPAQNKSIALQHAKAPSYYKALASKMLNASLVAMLRHHVKIEGELRRGAIPVMHLLIQSLGVEGMRDLPRVGSRTGNLTDIVLVDVGTDTPQEASTWRLSFEASDWGGEIQKTIDKLKAKENLTLDEKRELKDAENEKKSGIEKIKRAVKLFQYVAEMNSKPDLGVEIIDGETSSPIWCYETVALTDAKGRPVKDADGAQQYGKHPKNQMVMSVSDFLNYCPYAKSKDIPTGMDGEGWEAFRKTKKRKGTNGESTGTAKSVEASDITTENLSAFVLALLNKIDDDDFAKKLDATQDQTVISELYGLWNAIDTKLPTLLERGQQIADAAEAAKTKAA